METWRKALRDGFIPEMTTPHLEALRDMLRADDPRLCQGATTVPPPLMCVQDWPVEKCCMNALGGVMENGGFFKATVGQAEAAFAELCYKADMRLGEQGACKYLLNWYDETPREEMRVELLAEVELALAARGKEVASAAE
jgi:hypothetical protein